MPGACASAAITSRSTGIRCWSDLLVECLAESGDVFIGLVVYRLIELLVVEPKAHPIKEVKAGSINQATAVGLVFGPQKDRGGKDPVEALHDSAVNGAKTLTMEKSRGVETIRQDLNTIREWMR